MLCCPSFQRTKSGDTDNDSKLNEIRASAHQIPCLYLHLVRLFLIDEEGNSQQNCGAVSQTYCPQTYLVLVNIYSTDRMCKLCYKILILEYDFS